MRKWTKLSHPGPISCSWHLCKSREPYRALRGYGNLNRLFSTSFDIAVSILVLLTAVDDFFIVSDLSIIEELQSLKRYTELLFDALGIHCLKLFDGYSFSILLDLLLEVLRVDNHFLARGLHVITYFVK